MRERGRAEKEGVEIEEVIKAKEEYIAAGEFLGEAFLFDGHREGFHVVYNPGLNALASLNLREGVVNFSLPNRKYPKDPFSFQAKRGILAHEFAHVMDVEHHNYLACPIETFMEYYISFEQRANLRAFYLMPEETYKMVKEEVELFFFLEGVDVPESPGTEEMMENLYALEFLGSCGLERSYNPIEFFEEFYRKMNIPLDILLRKRIWYSFAGVVTSTENDTCERYGIKRMDELKNLQLWLARKISGRGIKTREKKVMTKMCNERYEAMNLFPGNRKACETGLRNFKRILPTWEEKARKYNRFGYWNDIYRQSKRIEERMEYVLG